MTKTTTATRASSDIVSLTLVAFIGIGVLFVAGFANSATLHNATHDSRHAAGFPCH